MSKLDKDQRDKLIGLLKSEINSYQRLAEDQDADVEDKVEGLKELLTNLKQNLPINDENDLINNLLFFHCAMGLHEDDHESIGELREIADNLDILDKLDEQLRAYKGAINQNT